MAPSASASESASNRSGSGSPKPAVHSHNGNHTHTIHLLNTCSDRDILLGRGSGVARQQSNVWFRTIVEARAEDYLDAIIHGTKTAIAKEIIGKVRDDGRRFVRKLSAKEMPAMLAAVASGEAVVLDNDRNGAGHAGAGENRRDGCSGSARNTEAVAGSNNQHGDGKDVLRNDDIEDGDTAAAHAGVEDIIGTPLRLKAMYEVITDENVLIQKTKQAFRHAARKLDDAEAIAGAAAKSRTVVAENAADNHGGSCDDGSSCHETDQSSGGGGMIGIGISDMVVRPLKRQKMSATVNMGRHLHTTPRLCRVGPNVTTTESANTASSSSVSCVSSSSASASKAALSTSRRSRGRCDNGDCSDGGGCMVAKTLTRDELVEQLLRQQRDEQLQQQQQRLGEDEQIKQQHEQMAQSQAQKLYRSLPRPAAHAIDQLTAAPSSTIPVLLRSPDAISSSSAVSGAAFDSALAHHSDLRLLHELRQQRQQQRQLLQKVQMQMRLQQHHHQQQHLWQQQQRNEGDAEAILARLRLTQALRSQQPLPPLHRDHDDDDRLLRSLHSLRSTPSSALQLAQGSLLFQHHHHAGQGDLLRQIVVPTSPSMFSPSALLLPSSAGGVAAFAPPSSSSRRAALIKALLASSETASAPP